VEKTMSAETMTDENAGWVQLSLRVDPDSMESAESALWEAGAVSVTFLDAEDHPVHEPGPGEMLLWPEVVMVGLFQAGVDEQAIAETMQQSGLISSPTAIRFDPLAERDWERAWMDQYQPLQFGQDLWICPSHIEPDPDWPLVIRLDPGLAFGSGTHPTTALCLEWIDSQKLAGKQVIDFGCGSGILAIACALKGAAEVTAVDHDPQALLATADNAGRNEVAGIIECLAPDAFEARPVDCVMANILAGPLIALAPLLSDCVKPGGHLVLSGILRNQAADVAAAYTGQLDLVDQSVREDWVRLVFSAPG